LPVYKYETHAHTCDVSHCAKITPAGLAKLYKALGYEGIFVTNHFYNGEEETKQNWAERINHYCGGYEAVWEEGNKIGLDVFFGWEFSYWGTDYLTYGLDKRWLLAHEGFDGLPIREYSALIHAEGGFIIHAHPFREARYIEMIRLTPREVDGVEILNANRLDAENGRAAWYAENYGLLVTAGSDTHADSQKRFCGLKVKKRFVSVFDMINAVKSGEAKLFTEYADKA
jgi:histidinol phosphatase-like PHP family hydrolase